MEMRPRNGCWVCAYLSISHTQIDTLQRTRRALAGQSSQLRQLNRPRQRIHHKSISLKKTPSIPTNVAFLLIYPSSLSPRFFSLSLSLSLSQTGFNPPATDVSSQSDYLIPIPIPNPLTHSSPASQAPKHPLCNTTPSFQSSTTYYILHTTTILPTYLTHPLNSGRN